MIVGECGKALSFGDMNVGRCFAYRRGAKPGLGLKLDPRTGGDCFLRLSPSEDRRAPDVGLAFITGVADLALLVVENAKFVVDPNLTELQFGEHQELPDGAPVICRDQLCLSVSAPENRDIRRVINLVTNSVSPDFPAGRRICFGGWRVIVEQSRGSDIELASWPIKG